MGLITVSDETIEEVKNWLTASGISADRLKLSQGLNWISFDATASEAEALLKAQYYVYEHASGQRHVACEEYSIPAHLKERVDFVQPTTHFDVKLKTRQNNGLTRRQSTGAKSIGKPGSGSTPKLGQWLSQDAIISELANCDEQIVPDCLRALYKIPEKTAANSENSYGVVEYTPQAYLGTDLDLFFGNYSVEQVGNRPTFDSIDGGVLQTTDGSFDYNG